MSKLRGNGFLLKARTMLSNDAISRIFHLQYNVDGICTRKLFFNLIFITLGSSLCLVPALVLWTRFDHKLFDPFGEPGLRASAHGGSDVLQELFRWSVITGMGWSTFWIADTLFLLLPSLIRIFVEVLVLRPWYWVFRAKDEKTELSDRTWRHIKHFLALTPYMTRLLTALVVAYSVSALVGDYESYIVWVDGRQRRIKWGSGRFYLLNLPHALSIILFAVLLEKIVLQRIAIAFHSRNYASRIEENNFCLQVLQVLKAKLRSKAFTPLTDEDGVLTPPIQPLLNSPMQPLLKSTMQPLLKSTVQPLFDSPMQPLFDSESLAIDIFDALRISCSFRDHLQVDDFCPFFKPPEMAKRFFDFLDLDHNGTLTRREALDGITRIYDERDCLDASLSSNTAFIKRLDSLLQGVFLSIAAFFVIALFETGVWGSLATLAGIMLGIKVVFESSASSLFLSIVFVLVTHPFDIGDLIVIDNNISTTYTVVDVDLMTTTLLGPNGLTYASNASLADSIIGNVKRSQWQVDLIPLSLDVNSFTSATLKHLEQLLIDFAIANARDYQAGVKIRSLNWDSQDILSLQILLPHRSSFFDVRLTEERRVRFMSHLMRSLQVTGLRLSPLNRDWSKLTP